MIPAGSTFTCRTAPPGADTARSWSRPTAPAATATSKPSTGRRASSRRSSRCAVRLGLSGRRHALASAGGGDLPAARALRDRFAIAADAEVTLEANPEDVTREAIAAWRAAGVNRISAGIQSLADGELAAVGRRHDAARAREALELLVASGLSSRGT